MSVCRLLLEKRSPPKPRPQPSPSLLASERACWAPAVSPPQLPLQMLVINRDQCEAGLASGSSLPVLLVVVCVSENVFVQASLCVCKCPSKGCSDCSFGLLPEVKSVSCTLLLLAFCSPLPPRYFVKPLTRQLNSPEARSWKWPSILLLCSHPAQGAFSVHRGATF